MDIEMEDLREENTRIMDKLDAIIDGQAPTVKKRILDILKQRDTCRSEQLHQQRKAAQTVAKHSAILSMVVFCLVGILWIYLENDVVRSVLPIWHDNTLLVVGYITGCITFLSLVLWCI